MKRPSDWTQDELVALCTGLGLLLLLVVVCGALLLAGGHGDASKGSTTAKSSRPETAVKYVSGGLSRSDLEALGQARDLSEIFWLGPPANDVKLVTDTHRQSRKIQLAYLDRWAQRKIQEGKVAYSVLVITQSLSPKSEASQEAQLKRMSGKVLRVHGFTAYLPSKKYLNQHRFFLISADRRWGGVIDYGSGTSLAEAQTIAGDVRILRVSPR